MQSADFFCHGAIDGNQEDHNSKASQNTWSQHCPQEVEGYNHLDWSRPDHCQEVSVALQSSSINRHEVHYLANVGLLTSSIAKLQCLFIDGRNNSSLDVHARFTEVMDELLTQETLCCDSHVKHNSQPKPSQCRRIRSIDEGDQPTGKYSIEQVTAMVQKIVLALL